MFCSCDSLSKSAKSRRLAGLVVILGGMLTVFVAVNQARSAPPAAAPATQPTTKPTAVNKQCPVTPDHAVDPKAPTVTYKGKVIGFCCEDCIEDFNKDPEKYMKDLK